MKDITEKKQIKQFPYEYELKKEVLFYPPHPYPLPPGEGSQAAPPVADEAAWERSRNPASSFLEPVAVGGSSRGTCLEGDILEIGPGRGDLLLALAESQPNKKFVAVEIGKKRYFRLIPRIEKRGIKNILLIRGDARVIIPQYFSEGTFEKIFVLFPDPWPKDRHAFRRLLQTEFLWLLAHHLKEGGELIIGTDVEWYARWATDNLKQIPILKNRLAPDLFASTLPGITPTFFEQKWKDEGRKIHYLHYRKSG